MDHDPTTDRPIVARAVRALRGFGDPITRAQAASLLPMWRHFTVLEQHEISAILAQFPAGRPGGWSQVAVGQAHRAGDHSRCRPSGCLAARTDQGTPAPEGTQQRVPVPCAVCGGLIQHVTEIPHQPYWAHLGSITGPPHAAAPAGGGA